MMTQEQLDFSVKLTIGSSINNITTTTAKDRSDQKLYMEHRLEEKSSLEKLTDNLKVESLARSGWTKVLNVTTVMGKVFNILDHSVNITETEMDAARLNQTTA